MRSAKWWKLSGAKLSASKTSFASERGTACFSNLFVRLLLEWFARALELNR
jgi:hypothetical protein